jgi:hypothetical protein
VARQRRMREARPTTPSLFANRGAGSPHPALRATLSQGERASYEKLGTRIHLVASDASNILLTASLSAFYAFIRLYG